MGLAPPRGLAALCFNHCSVCVALNIRDMMTGRRPLLPPRYDEAVSGEIITPDRGCARCGT
jgi:hypothetical protein